jgi:hypothetical protein
MLSACATEMLKDGQKRGQKFPTISDSKRVNMRRDTISGMKTKSAFNPLLTRIIGIL